MTDRELLELAAKAAGLRVCWHEGDVAARHMDRTEPPRIYWNPLTDDGDALRLAVKLRLYVRIENYGTAARRDDSSPWNCCETHLHGGVEAATRRAIVRAAAELGKATP